MEIIITIKIVETQKTEKTLMEIYTERLEKWLKEDK